MSISQGLSEQLSRTDRQGHAAVTWPEAFIGLATLPTARVAYHDRPSAARFRRKRPCCFWRELTIRENVLQARDAPKGTVMDTVRRNAEALRD